MRFALGNLARDSAEPQPLAARLPSSPGCPKADARPGTAEAFCSVARSSSAFIPRTGSYLIACCCSRLPKGRCTFGGPTAGQGPFDSTDKRAVLVNAENLAVAGLQTKEAPFIPVRPGGTACPGMAPCASTCVRAAD